MTPRNGNPKHITHFCIAKVKRSINILVLKNSLKKIVKMSSIPEGQEP
jgi:hypothetical protein